MLAPVLRLVSVILVVLAVAGCKRPSGGAPPDPRLRVAVDPRVELMSILFRLAGNPEYNKAYASSYQAAVDAHFGKYRGHPAVSASRELHEKNGIGFEAPQLLGLYLTSSQVPIRPLSPRPPGLERWQGVALEPYLEKIRAFVVESGFETFFRSQSGFFDTVAGRFSVYPRSEPVLAWLDTTFGKREGAAYLLAPGLLTGPMAYGGRAVHADGTEEIVQIMYLENVDAQGAPRPTKATLEYFVHELAHSYVNPSMESRMSGLEDVAIPVFRKVEKEMRKQSYTTPAIMVNEAIVRAVTILFLRDAGHPTEADASLRTQERLSFHWTRDLVTALDDARKKNGGKVEIEALANATRTTLSAWSGDHP